MTIICVLPGEFHGQTTEVDRETEGTFERVIPVYGQPGVLVYPKGPWRRATEIMVIEPTIDRYPDKEDDLH